MAKKKAKLPKAINDLAVDLSPEAIDGLLKSLEVNVNAEDRPPGAMPKAATEVEAFTKDYLSASQTARIRQLASELASRRSEALNLYSPMFEQESFHRSRVSYRIVRGSNRSGKTLSAAIEVARAATCSDPYKKYPSKGIIFIVGKDEKHLGQVIYKKLFRPGAFRIIRDEETKKWRAYRTWDEGDQLRYDSSMESPAIIPRRYISNIAWNDKGKNIPSLVSLTTGWEMYFFSSLGKPPQGSAIDIFWFDEEIVDEGWYPEMAARILDRNGKGIWSATPQTGTEQLYELHEKANKEAFLPVEDRRIEEFVLLLADNKYISDNAKKNLARDLSEEEARVRIGGEYAIIGYKMYPTFRQDIHGVVSSQVPAKWTRYAYIDPGHRTCAVLFVAIPPPPDDTFLVYKELYLREVNAHIFGEAMKRSTADEVIEAFVIDPHGSLISDIGSGKTVLQQYSEALQKNGVRSLRTGHGFLFANSDVSAGILAVQGLLRVRENGNPRLRVMLDFCPNFLEEIKRYHRKRVGNTIRDEPDNRRANHLMDTLRYAAMHDPKYVPGQKEVKYGESYRHYLAKLKRKKDRDGGSGIINLGPGGKFF